jgi:hypothetical protein
MDPKNRTFDCIFDFAYIPLIAFEPIGRFHEIQQGDHAIKGHLEATLFNLTASTI